MKILSLSLVIVLGVTKIVSAQTATLAWDYIGKSLTEVQTYVQEVKVDGVVNTAVPTCVTSGANVSCSVSAPTLATGLHTVSIGATKNGVTALTTITGIGGANNPINPSNPKVVITITINVGG